MSNTTQDKLVFLKQSLSAQFMERDEVAEGMVASVLSRQNCLLVGPPGTAKSQMVQFLCRSFEGANYFQWLLTKFTTPEELFGPYSLEELEHGRYLRITKGKLPEAHIAFLDEVFKASSAILNTLLTIINERIFYNDSTPVECPLISLFGASNELPQGEELGALYDRFLLRFHVDYIGEDGLFRQMLTVKKPIPADLTLDDLLDAQEQVNKVQVPDVVIDLIVKVRGELRRQGIVASDRRWHDSLQVLKAYAWLAGEDEVTDEDLVNLQHVLWDEPSQKKDVLKVILTIVNPHETRAIELQDMAYSVYQTANNEASAIEALQKFKNILSELEGLKQTRKVKEIVEEVHKYQKEVMARCLGIDL